MIGLVIVSHSAHLAEGVVELAREMAGAEVRIAAAGGLDLPGQPLGTDAALIAHAIESVYSDDGVLVLMDLGSAILSTEFALDLITAEQRARVLLCGAPLIEGALAAAVQARMGSALADVAAEAQLALGPKNAQLTLKAIPTGSAVAEIAAPNNSDIHTIQLTVTNKFGLHARPAARLVQLAGHFQSTLSVRDVSSGRGPANVKSINGVAMLGARQGHTLVITADGHDAVEALAAIQQLAAANFGDDDSPSVFVPAAAPTKTPPHAALLDSGTLQGLAASPGIVLSVARQFRLPQPLIPNTLNTNPEAEWQQLLGALDQTRTQIEAVLAQVSRQTDPHTAEIFEAHRLFLTDDALREPAWRAIVDQHLNAAAAWKQSTDRLAAEYHTLDDDYLRARAADVEAIGRQVILNVLGETGLTPTLDAPGILIVTDLTPADTARLDTTRVLGIATADGSSTSHSAILARAAGIPAVVGLGQSILQIKDGTMLIVDGDSGQVIVTPNNTTHSEYKRRADQQQAAQSAAHAESALPAVTTDGHTVLVAANIGSAADAKKAVSIGAEGVGLFRTEFLFLGQQNAPTEDEQYAAYYAAAMALAGRPLVIRTLDVGGDKPLPYIDLGDEANPFLGVRAIRLCLAQPELFKTQLRAILRAAADVESHSEIQVMYPMIAMIDEFRAANKLLAEARQELRQRGLIIPNRISTGIMVEIPAAALLAEQFAAEVDFFSIGTNDLTQYTMAAERGNPRLATLTDAFQPAVLRLIAHVVEAAHAQGKWVSVCGELAGEPLAVPLLIGLGVDELSMNAVAIPRAKQIIRKLNQVELVEPMRAVLNQQTPFAVRSKMADYN